MTPKALIAAILQFIFNNVGILKCLRRTIRPFHIFKKLWKCGVTSETQQLQVWEKCGVTGETQQLQVWEKRGELWEGAQSS